MEDVRELTNFLGGTSVVGSPQSDFEFIEVIRKGLPSEVIQCVVKSSAVGDRFAKVVVAATDVLGDRSKAREWLLSENRALGGQRPIDLLDTGIGFEDVMDVLRRIEHGVYS